jgi:hypothetical protein
VVVDCSNIREWPRVKYKTKRTELTTLQSLACLGIIGAMRTTPRATAEVFLKSSPLYLKMEAEAQIEFIDSATVNNGSKNPYGVVLELKERTHHTNVN